MLERGWVAGLPVYPSSRFSQRCKSIHTPGRKLCLSRWKKYLRGGRKRRVVFVQGWRKVIWILIKLLRWFRWLLKQVCLGADSGYESAEWVWTSFCRVVSSRDIRLRFDYILCMIISFIFLSFSPILELPSKFIFDLDCYWSRVFDYSFEILFL